ncbi:hypothetical protein JCM11641_006737 [Rhodosporidiobolus odoratus]
MASSTLLNLAIAVPLLSLAIFALAALFLYRRIRTLSADLTAREQRLQALEAAYLRHTEQPSAISLRTLDSKDSSTKNASRFATGTGPIATVREVPSESDDSTCPPVVRSRTTSRQAKPLPASSSSFASPTYKGAFGIAELARMEQGVHNGSTVVDWGRYEPMSAEEPASTDTGDISGTSSKTKGRNSPYSRPASSLPPPHDYPPSLPFGSCRSTPFSNSNAASRSRFFFNPSPGNSGGESSDSRTTFTSRGSRVLRKPTKSAKKRSIRVPTEDSSEVKGIKDRLRPLRRNSSLQPDGLAMPSSSPDTPVSPVYRTRKLKRTFGVGDGEETEDEPEEEVAGEDGEEGADDADESDSLMRDTVEVDMRDVSTRLPGWRRAPPTRSAEATIVPAFSAPPSAPPSLPRSVSRSHDPVRHAVAGSRCTPMPVPAIPPPRPPSSDVSHMERLVTPPPIPGTASPFRPSPLARTPLALSPAYSDQTTPSASPAAALQGISTSTRPERPGLQRANRVSRSGTSGMSSHFSPGVGEQAAEPAMTFSTTPVVGGEPTSSPNSLNDSQPSSSGFYSSADLYSNSGQPPLLPPPTPSVPPPKSPSSSPPPAADALAFVVGFDPFRFPLSPPTSPERLSTVAPLRAVRPHAASPPPPSPASAPSSLPHARQHSHAHLPSAAEPTRPGSQAYTANRSETNGTTHAEQGSAMQSRSASGGECQGEDKVGEGGRSLNGSILSEMLDELEGFHGASKGGEQVGQMLLSRAVENVLLREPERISVREGEEGEERMDAAEEEKEEASTSEMAAFATGRGGLPWWMEMQGRARDSKGSLVSDPERVGRLKRAGLGVQAVEAGGGPRESWLKPTNPDSLPPSSYPSTKVSLASSGSHYPPTPATGIRGLDAK